VRLPCAGIAAQQKALVEVGPGPELLRPLPADGERVAGVGHRLEVLERAAVVGGRNPYPGPALVGAALLVDDLLGGPAQLTVALGRKRLAEEDDLLGLELPPAAQAASGERRATAVGGWRTWHSG
jgi:hypothetical protein